MKYHHKNYTREPMRFIIVCVDKSNPENSEVVPKEEIDSDLEEPQSLVFKTKEKAEAWIKADEKEFPDVYDYHILEV